MTVTATGDGRAALTVSDNGVGYDPTQPRKGIGQKLITALSKKLGDEPRFTLENGTRFDVSFPTSAP